MSLKIIRHSTPTLVGHQSITQEETFVAGGVAYRSDVHCDTSYPNQSWAVCKRVDNGTVLATMHPQREAGLNNLNAYSFDANVTPEPFLAIFDEFRRVAEEVALAVEE